MTANEREKVKAFIANPNGPVAREARPADGARRRRTKPAAPRERKADKWATWFYARMLESNSHDPAEHLPDALAELEQKITDTLRTELAHAQQKIRELERIAKTGTIVCWKTDAPTFKATPVMSDGTDGAVLDVRPFLQRYHDEVGGVS